MFASLHIAGNLVTLGLYRGVSALSAENGDQNELVLGHADLLSAPNAEHGAIG